MKDETATNETEQALETENQTGCENASFSNLDQSPDLGHSVVQPHMGTGVEQQTDFFLLTPKASTPSEIENRARRTGVVNGF